MPLAKCMSRLANESCTTLDRSSVPPSTASSSNVSVACRFDFAFVHPCAHSTTRRIEFEELTVKRKLGTIWSPVHNAPRAADP